ncbi:MAG: mandelate racemase/muconate lactonizing enzyme family protein [Planctomycetota bacterium]
MYITELDLHLVEIARTDGAPPVRSVLLRLAEESGVEGWGEAALAWRGAELPGRRNALLSILSGRSVFDTEELLSLVALRVPGLRAAVETACWDIVGRLVRQPIYRLWGGEYRHGAQLAVRLPAGTPERTAEVGWAMAEQGWLTQIIPASGNLDQDLNTLSALGARSGQRVQLRLDGRSLYDLQTARDLCSRIESGQFEFLLDPLCEPELYGVASLARQTSVPLGVWRAIHGPADVLAAIRAGAAAVVVVDLELVGGPTAVRKCASVAEAGGVRALLGGRASVGIATAMKLQLAAATPALAGFCECAYHQLQDDILSVRLAMMDGMLLAPQGPGLGVTVDRARLERYAVT